MSISSLLVPYVISSSSSSYSHKRVTRLPSSHQRYSRGTHITLTHLPVLFWKIWKDINYWTHPGRVTCIYVSKIALITRFMGPTWAHLGLTGPRWAPCWPHELCYLGCHSGFRKRRFACSAPDRYLSQCWSVVNGTLTENLRWNFNKNTTISIEKSK